ATATATSGGASEPKSGSEADKYLNDPEYSQYANTEDGQITAIAALALSDLTSTNTVKLASAKQATVSGAFVAEATSANSASLVADGSAVDSASGVASAFGLNIADVINEAIIAQDIVAGSVDL